MGSLDTRIPLQVKAPDVGGSFLKGVELARSLFGKDDMTPYQREMLNLRRAEFARGGQITPYQSATIGLRERELENAAAYRAQPKSVTEGLRHKLASGQDLSPGEQRVYDDSVKMNAFDRMLLGNSNFAPRGQGGMIPPAATRYLRSNSSDPEVRRQFEEHYGQPADAFLR